MWHGNYLLNWIWFVSCSLCNIFHISKKDLYGWKYTQYNIITDVIFCHIHHIQKDYICGTQHIPCKFMCIKVQFESVFVILIIKMYVIIFVADIITVSYLRYNAKFYILYYETNITGLNYVNVGNMYKLISYDQSLCVWVYGIDK